MNKKVNPQDKKSMRIQARFTQKEWRLIEALALAHARGNFSEWIRQAALNYRPLKR